MPRGEATCKGAGRLVCSGYECRSVAHGAGGEENSWETLAEDLFGIDLGADPARDSLVVPEDLSLDEPESSSSEAKAAKDAPDNPAPNPRAGKHEGAGSSAEKKRVEEERRPAGRGARPAAPVAAG